MGTGQAAGLAAAQACGSVLPDVRTLPAAPLIARLKALGAAL